LHVKWCFVPYPFPVVYCKQEKAACRLFFFFYFESSITCGAVMTLSAMHISIICDALFYYMQGILSITK
jgi:hypothetical protein